jgi:hypothetical protein
LCRSHLARETHNHTRPHTTTHDHTQPPATVVITTPQAITPPPRPTSTSRLLGAGLAEKALGEKALGACTSAPAAGSPTGVVVQRAIDLHVPGIEVEGNARELGGRDRMRKYAAGQQRGKKSLMRCDRSRAHQNMRPRGRSCASSSSKARPTSSGQMNTCPGRFHPQYFLTRTGVA